MDQNKRTSAYLGKSNNKIYMDLQSIVREHALHFLPAKSLFRCRGVCRDWKFMISTPFFAHGQSIAFRSISGFFCQTHNRETSFVSLDPMAYGVPDPSLRFLPEPVDIRTSSNGLLCCQGQTEDKAYYICNPATKRWKKLPIPENNHGSEPALVLIFEPSLMNFVAEYKLVCAFPSEIGGYEFDIYSSSEDSWRTSGEMFLGDGLIHPSSGIYVNGVIYWLLGHGRILAFDLNMERSQILYGNGTLGMMDGKLCTASLHHLNLSLKVLNNEYSNTMQMNSNNKTWVLHHITLDKSIVEGNARDLESVLFVNSNVLVIRGGSALYVHDMKTDETKRVEIVYGNCKKAVPYVNSLVDI